MKTLKTFFHHVSITVFVFFSNLVLAANDDPFADLGDKAEEATDSLMNIAIPLFVLAFVALIILRALNVIGNRLLMIAGVSLFALALLQLLLTKWSGV